MKETTRARVMQEVIAGAKTVEAAARELGLSERHAYRVLAKVRHVGPLGVIHGNRGRASPRRTPDGVREEVIRLRQGPYAGYNDRHFADELRDEEGMGVGRETVRKLLREAGIPAVRKAKRSPHRSRRARKESFGQMLQGDASIHDWLEGRGPWLTLVHFVDDATGYHWADFFPAETTEAYFTVMKRIIRKHGVPRSLYVDRDSVFTVNRSQSLDEQLSGRRPQTQFGRAMAELGIPIILAKSPQAKGRVERRGGLDQDRLVSELRRAKARTLEEARVVLRGYLRKSNRRFTVKAAAPEPCFLSLPEGCDLRQVLCWKEERTVANDNTIAFHGRRLQIPKSAHRQTFAKAKVAVHVCLDGSVHVFHRRQRIACFKKPGVDRDKLPLAPHNSTTLANHSPILTFSLGH